MWGKYMLDTNNVVSKSNTIVDLKRLNLSLQELKVLDVYLSRINPKDESTAQVTFTKQEYCDLMQIESKNLKTKRLSRYIQHLFDNSVVEWLDDEDSFKLHHLFEEARYDKNTKEIILECGKSQYIRKMFFNINTCGYIKYALKNTIHLKSIYSIKLYLYFLQNRFRKCWDETLDELKENVLEVSDVEMYSQFKFFNFYILKPCIKEINEKTNIEVSYNSIKRGRNTFKIHFSCQFKDTEEILNGEFEEKVELPPYNHDEDVPFDYVINEIQEEFGRELRKAELKFANDFYELYGGRMMIVALNESAVYGSRSLHYMKQLLETWTLKGYTVEQVENGER